MTRGIQSRHRQRNVAAGCHALFVVVLMAIVKNLLFKWRGVW
jgi:hypothetical protein